MGKGTKTSTSSQSGGRAVRLHGADRVACQGPDKVKCQGADKVGAEYSTFSSDEDTDDIRLARSNHIDAYLGTLDGSFLKL